MEWFKLSTKLPRDPKWKRLSPRAKVAYIEWACEIAEQETDGLYYASGSTPRYVDELIEAGLVVAVAEGYELPAFLKWNRTRDEMEADREARSRAGRKAADARWHANRMPNAPTVRMQEVEVEREVEEPKALTTSSIEADFLSFWGIYPRREGKRAARQSFEKALRRTEPGVILDGARRYRDDPNRDPGYTAHPSTWLNQDRWDDDPLPPRDGGRRPGRGANRHLAALADQLEGK